MYILLEQMSKTNSILEKEKILSKYKNNQKIKDLIYYALNTFQQTYIKKIEKPKVCGNLTVEDCFSNFQMLYNDLITRRITGNQAKNVVNDFLKLCNEDAQDFYIKVLKKDFKCGLGEGVAKRIWGDDFLPKFEVQLANKYNFNKNYNIEYWFANEKLDGCLSGETVVELKKGGLKTIKDVVENKINDKIKCYNIRNNKIEYKNILNYVINGDDINEKKYEWFEIEIENGQKIKITGNHRVYLPKLKCYRRADELTEKDEILLK